MYKWKYSSWVYGYICTNIILHSYRASHVTVMRMYMTYSTQIETCISSVQHPLHYVTKQPFKMCVCMHGKVMFTTEVFLSLEVLHMNNGCRHVKVNMNMNCGPLNAFWWYRTHCTMEYVLHLRIVFASEMENVGLNAVSDAHCNMSILHLKTCCYGVRDLTINYETQL